MCQPDTLSSLRLISPASEMLPADSSQLKPFSGNCLQPKEAASPKVTSSLRQHLSEVRREYEENKNHLHVLICDKFKDPIQFQNSLRNSSRPVSQSNFPHCPILLLSLPDMCYHFLITSYMNICVLPRIFPGKPKSFLKLCAAAIWNTHSTPNMFFLPSKPLLMWCLRPGMQSHLINFAWVIPTYS